MTTQAYSQIARTIGEDIRDQGHARHDISRHAAAYTYWRDAVRHLTRDVALEIARAGWTTRNTEIMEAQ